MSTQPQTEDWINGIRNQKLSLLIYLFIYYIVCVDERIKEMVGLCTRISISIHPTHFV